MKRLCLKVEGKRESNLVEENWFLKTIVLLRCESFVATPDPAKAYLC
jgi:hypothetical protein